MARSQLSAAQARRLALGAQGFADSRPTGRVDRRHLRRVIDRMGLIQIDSVNVLVRSQELPLFARLGPHPRTLVDDATADGELFEYWVHEASHVPTEHHHLYRWRMRSPHRWGVFRRLMADRPEFVEQVYQHVADNGPIVAGDLKQRVGKKGTWWDYDDGKVALEVLFHEGRIGARRRSNDFARLYDIAERLVPSDALDRPTIRTPGVGDGNNQYQLTLFGFADHPLLEKVQKLDVNAMTPIEAMQFLQEAKANLDQTAK
jgi:uncharacterized protein YcaQ